MTTLLLLRHGAAAGQSGGGDRARRLTPAGRRESARVGRFLAASELAADLVLTSSAARALQTAEEVADAAGWSVEVRALDALYLPSVPVVLDTLARHGGDADAVLAVGHEPTWSGLLGHLTSAVVRYPTAALAVVDLHAGRWEEVDEATRGELRAFVPPRLLRGVSGR